MVAKKTAARKSTAKPAEARKTVAKPRGTVKVKVIQTVDSAPNQKEFAVYFTDGTHAVVKSGTKLSNMLLNPENVAPNMIQVTLSSRGEIVAAERVDTGGREA